MSSNNNGGENEVNRGSGTTTMSERGSVGIENASSRVKKNRNAPGNRSDIGWKHGISVNGDARKIQCKYCQKVFSGGVYRFKHHLAGTQKDVEPCLSVSDEIRKEMWDIVASLQQNLIKKTRKSEEALAERTNNNDEEEGDDHLVGEKRKGKEIETSSLFKRRGMLTQPTVNTMFKKNLREEACENIASFFYNNAIPFNVARSKEFVKMFDSVARHGLGFKPPSYTELRVKYLKKKVESAMEIIKEHREYWMKIGCTIMTDGWTDKRRRTILNFLVNSPKGTVFLKSIDASHICKTADQIFKLLDEVVEEVGEENVVQVVTDNAANYKAAGKMLMEKRKKLYWTPCAAHCIDLMLEDFEKKVELHRDTIAKGRKVTTYIYSRTSLITLLQFHTKGKDLIRPGMTCFATSYLTLGCLNDRNNALIRMFTSDEWKSNKCSRTRDGKTIENIVLDRLFWRDIIICLKAAYPLIHVLRLVDSDESPAMGYIFEAIDRAKEKIHNAFQGVQRSFMLIWEIIDARWEKQLHRPLHTAGYYLNPQMHYSPEFKTNFEIKRGLYECLGRLVGNVAEMTKIDAQLEDFKSQSKFFGTAIAKAALKTKTPSQWWDSYGEEHPELQRFAIRVLSLTCSSSECERNWSAFEMVHTKRRNHLKQKTMNDVVFVMTNSRLAKKKKTRNHALDYCLDDLDSDEEWIMEDDDDDVLDNLEDLDIPDLGNLVHGEGGSNDGGLLEDLEIPPLNDGNGGHGGVQIEDHEYDDHNINDLL